MDFSLRQLMQGIQALGLSTVAKSVIYALRKRRLEAPPAPPEPARTPGRLTDAAPLERGLRLRFERAELEVLFLASDLCRVSWGPAPEPVPYSLAMGLEPWPPVEVRAEETAEAWSVAASGLRLEIAKADGSIAWRDGEGQPLRAELPPEFCGTRLTHRARLAPEESLFGLGEKSGPLNRRGRVYRFWNRDPGGQYADEDPLYLSIPAYLSLLRRGGFLVFYENSHPASFDLAAGQPGLAEHRFEGGMLRYYLMAGPPERTVARFLRLTGAPPLPPLWALGYHQSRYSYFPEGRVREIADAFERHDLPLDAIHLDLHYLDRNRPFTWDPARFPDPRRLCSDLLAKGVRLVGIVDSPIEWDESSPRYRSGLERGVFCRLPDGSVLKAVMWPGWCAFPDFTDPAARAWWAEQYRPVIEDGLAGIWNDMNEPTAFAAFGDTSLPTVMRHAFEGRGGDHAEAHNLYGLLEVRATREGLEAIRPDRRPFILSRSGWAGLQRYAWHWTGDSRSDWDSLRQVVPMVLGLSLSGVFYTGADIGGFNGTPTPELYARWLQLGVCLPFCRTHTVIGSPDQEPWSYGESWLRINREAIRLRYSLLPYLYTLAWQATAQSKPLVRPLFWDAPDQPRLWNVSDAFLLGDALLVAPVLREGERELEIELPPGAWYDLATDEFLAGGSESVRRPVTPERIPILVRAGGVLPRVEPGRNTASRHSAPLLLHLYSPASDAEAVSWLYSDAGDGGGASRVDRFVLRREGRQVLLDWSWEGGFPWPYPGVELVLHAPGGATRSRKLTEPLTQVSFEL